jgi:hypothetical protein
MPSPTTPAPAIAPAARHDWTALVAREPRLRGLESIARRGGDSWPIIAASLRGLVGWRAARPDMSAPEAYEAAYTRLLTIYETAGGRC